VSLLFLLLAAAAATVAAQPAALTLTASPEQLTIANATKGGQVVLAGVSVSSEGGTRRIRRFAEVLKDDDGDGRLDFTPDGNVPRRSVWAVTDLQSGSTATAGGPERSVAHIAPLPTTALKKDLDGAISGFESGAVEVQLVILRPKKGAWMSYAYEGFEGDEDRTRNGIIRTLLTSAVPIAPEFGSAPTKAKKDDVLILLDIRNLLVGTTVVTN
jgi:hypothetical protein